MQSAVYTTFITIKDKPSPSLSQESHGSWIVLLSAQAEVADRLRQMIDGAVSHSRTHAQETEKAAGVSGQAKINHHKRIHWALKSWSKSIYSVKNM